MRILAIETSCDETAISIIEGKSSRTGVEFKVLGNALSSQAKLHATYGGVFPMMAKREHAKNILPLLIAVLKESKLYEKAANPWGAKKGKMLATLLLREPELWERLRKLEQLRKPDVDAIAVTYGPGLEPALWVGINFAKALALIWGVPVVPVNHMEGHIFGAMLQSAEKSGTNAEGRGRSSTYRLQTTRHPLLALLISGGHTELVTSPAPHKYKIIGETRDDAAGECFDKAARMLGLPYPGGPEISRLAEKGEANPKYKLPRPMIGSDNLDFSFSGLKTAVLYLLKETGTPSTKGKADIAREVEEAITDVLVQKTAKALKATKAKTLVLGGGVSANRKIRDRMRGLVKKEFPGVALFLPEPRLTTDNALMIGVAGYFNKNKTKKPSAIRANGNLRFKR